MRCDVVGRECATLLLQALRRTLLLAMAPSAPASATSRGKGSGKSKARSEKRKTSDGRAKQPAAQALMNALVAAASAPTSHPLHRAQCAASLR